VYCLVNDHYCAVCALSVESQIYCGPPQSVESSLLIQVLDPMTAS
jgi:hypothetical protein